MIPGVGLGEGVGWPAGLVGTELLGITLVSSMTVGEGVAVGLGSVKVEGGSWAGGKVEVNIPDGVLRVGEEERGSSGTGGEGLTGGMGETVLSGGGGDWVGRLPAGSVRVKKMVETTVTVTGLSAGGFVGCGDPLPSPRPVEEGSTGRGVEDGSTGGLTAVGVPEMPLERVTLGLSNSANLGEFPERPLPIIPRAHQIPTSVH